MTGPDSLAALPPARRAEIIYATARSEMTDRLWRAALGDSDDRGQRGTPNALGNGGLTIESLLQMVAGDRSGAPGTAAGTPGAAHGHGHCCCCHHGHDAAAAPGAATVSAVDPRSAAAARGTMQGTAVGLSGLLSAAQAGAPVDTGTLDLGPNTRFAPAISAAAAATGVPAPAIAAIIDAEAGRSSDGSWNPLSRNSRSSAAGLGQFLSGTWQDLAQTEGSWLNATARAQGWLDSSGRVRPDARGALLQLRYDPGASIRTVADFAKQNLERLESDGIRVRADSETVAKAAYLSHHLGLGDARRFLREGLDAGRARTLLRAQIGSAAADARIADTGGAVQAHRQWLLGYIDRRIRPERFAS